MFDDIDDCCDQLEVENFISSLVEQDFERPLEDNWTSDDEIEAMAAPLMTKAIEDLNYQKKYIKETVSDSNEVVLIDSFSGLGTLTRFFNLAVQVKELLD